ncbi:hypothetical protein UY3_12010 [Chelonia mydas]|uniref:Uncharacterized protein n=1 Tax=Chelonia mydas TaxID=8469 RepID=M7B5N2_CHEMY|nr:hypothetical protein UY3_12010 [Chelonia mydas]
MDSAQLYTIVVSITNISRLILQYSHSRYRSRCVEQCDAMQAALLEDIEQSNSQLLATVTHHLDTVVCRFWAWETSTDWWDRIVMQLWHDEQNFQMHKATFQELCDELSPALKHSNTKMRAALTVEKQVAKAL